MEQKENNISHILPSPLPREFHPPFAFPPMWWVQWVYLLLKLIHIRRWICQWISS